MVLRTGDRVAGDADPHRPKLQHLEMLAVHADPRRSIEDRPRRVEENCHRNHCEYRRNERSEQGKCRKVENALLYGCWIHNRLNCLMFSKKIR